MSFKVTKIIDGDTFEVTPKWIWNNTEGNGVRPTGYDTPERGQPGYKETTDKLSSLIFGKIVELKRPIKLSYTRLLCDVYYNGKNLASYFPEYKSLIVPEHLI